MMDLEGEVVNIFKGNEATVGSLSQSLETEIVSGCWDGTASVWDVETGKKKDVLSGHKHSVSVLSLQNGIIVTGSHDKKIRLWYRGKMENCFDADFCN